MAQLEFGKPFGLDLTQIKKKDWDLAPKRVLADMKTDFIRTPHVRFVFSHASEYVVEKLKAELKAGKFFPAAPISMEVPKTFRLPVRGSGQTRLGLLASNNLHEWQRMWIIGAMTQADSYDDAAVKSAAKVVGNGNSSDALRAVAANFVGKFGDHTRRDALREQYPNLPEYVRAAVFYASRKWPSVERGNAKALWSQDGGLHRAIAEAMANS